MKFPRRQFLHLPARADLVLRFGLEIAGVMALVQLFVRRPAGAVDPSPALDGRKADIEWIERRSWPVQLWLWALSCYAALRDGVSKETPAASWLPPPEEVDRVGRCPLWVKSGHRGQFKECPLYPRKRTLIASPPTGKPNWEGVSRDERERWLAAYDRYDGLTNTFQEPR